MKTTLKKIRNCSPCQSGWEKLLKSLGKIKADDADLYLLDVVESNGIEDAIWCLQAVDGYEREKRLFAVWCASEVRHLMNDARSLNALVVSERFAEGYATENELAAARAAAWDAAWDAAAWDAACDAAAWDAAWDAARDAARAAAWDAARDAARDAACDAAWDAARDAARAAAWDAARDAACDAACDAAWDAARAAAWAAARDAACDAACDAARDAQKTEFIRMLNCIENGERYEIKTTGGNNG